MSGVTIKGNTRDHGLSLDYSDVTFWVVICHSRSVSWRHGGSLGEGDAGLPYYLLFLTICHYLEIKNLI